MPHALTGWNRPFDHRRLRVAGAGTQAEARAAILLPDSSQPG